MNTMANAIPVDRFTLSPRRITDADWFGLEANPDGTINVPIRDPYQATHANPWATPQTTIRIEEAS